MKKFISWFCGFFEDQAGTASSKRVGAYFGLFLMYKVVTASLSGTTISDVVWYGTIGFTFGMWGMTLPEWFSPKGSMIGGAKIETPNEVVK